MELSTTNGTYHDVQGLPSWGSETYSVDKLLQFVFGYVLNSKDVSQIQNRAQYYYVSALAKCILLTFG